MKFFSMLANISIPSGSALVNTLKIVSPAFKAPLSIRTDSDKALRLPARKTVFSIDVGSIMMIGVRFSI